MGNLSEEFKRNGKDNEKEGKLRKILRRTKPVGKRIVKSASIICVSLAISSLGAAASETANKVGAVAKSAKSAKASSKAAKRFIDLGTVGIVCTNAGFGIDEVVNRGALGNKGKAFVITAFGVVLICGFIAGQEFGKGD